MWPRSGQRVLSYRRWLRAWEAGLILDRLRRWFPELAKAHGGAGPRILEFGSGGGHQIPVLKTLGRVVGSDVYISSGMSAPSVAIQYVLCDIAHAPFQNAVFDLVYSNHVLEHIAALDSALDEVQRVGAPDCIFTFAVPTPLWLFLELPAKYLDRAKHLLWKRLRLRRSPVPGLANDSSPGPARTPVTDAPTHPVRHRSISSWLFPGGHGEYRNFWQAVRAFRAARWRERFAQHGFRMIEERSILLYATARWPFIPANRLLPRLGLASSRLFIIVRQPPLEPRLAPWETARNIAAADLNEQTDEENVFGCAQRGDQSRARRDSDVRGILRRVQAWRRHRWTFWPRSPRTY
jgi:SAM-dependent methyltransferase